MSLVKMLKICAAVLLMWSTNQCVSAYRKSYIPYCRLKSGNIGSCTNFTSCDLKLLITEVEPVLCDGMNSGGGDSIICCPLKKQPSKKWLALNNIKIPDPTSIVKNTQPPASANNMVELINTKPSTRTNMKEHNSVSTKSSQKCLEYSKIKCSNTQTTRTIVRGEKVVSVDRYPHMALLGYSSAENPNYDNLSWQCGGTLISEEYILTAAHCLRGINKTVPVVAHLGFINKHNRNATNTLQEFKIVERIKHPDRKNPSSYADIALLKLDRPAILSKSVLPACLYEHDSFPTKKAQATGWGDLHADANLGSDDLMRVTLTIQDHENCFSLYPRNRHMKQGIKKDQQFCAGNDGRDTCQGDSGGPLQIIGNDYCMHNIIGITSFGNSCGLQPGVYTRVSHYVPWIESVVWP